MTWEPKQGEMVMARLGEEYEWEKLEFVCRSKGKHPKFAWHCYNKDGYVLAYREIAQIIEQKEPEITVGTVGSVWEKEEHLYVVVSENGDEVYVFCPETNETECYIDMAHFLQRKDKIGMAPCACKSLLIENTFYISNRIFHSYDDVRDYYNQSEIVKWPANNSMWVIVDRVN